MKHRYELARFDFSEADAIADHLSAMAAKGWQLDRTGPYLWGYRKTAPQKLRYAVGYLPGIHSAAPSNPDEVGAFRSLYEAAGWSFVTEWYFVQIFSTGDPGAVAPDTDETVKLEALRRSIGKQIWFNVLFAALLALLLGLSVWAGYRDPPAALSSNTALAAPWLLLAALAATAAPILRFQGWKRRAKRALADGGICPPLGRRHRRFWDGVLWLLLLLFAAAVISDACTTTGAAWGALRFAVWMGGLMALSSLNGWIRRRGGSRGVFWAVFALGFMIFAIVYWNLPNGSDTGWVSLRELPLSSQDLGYDAEDDEICRLKVSQSVLLKHVDAGELSGESQLSYDVYHTRAGWVYDLCLAEVRQYTDWEPLAGGIWIHPYENDGYAGASYLVVTPGTIIVLYPPEPLDDGQLATAISLLAP